MLEAWLLCDERAIRAAAGYPQGATPLRLPAPKNVEGLASPKDVLRAALLSAAPQKRSRRRQKIVGTGSTYDVAANVGDFRALQKLSAYQHFECDLDAALANGHL